MQTDYPATEPARADVDRTPGPLLLEFGSPGCGWCRAAQPAIAAALAAHPDVRHLKVSDARGRPLGRSFGVRLWPTLVFLKDGTEFSRVVRPDDADAIRAGLVAIDAKARTASASGRA